MNCYFSQLILLVAVAVVLGQQGSTTCSNNNLLMTPILREKILNVLNVARQKLATGQLLLTNGKYAIQAANLPDLTWSCEDEEEIFNTMEESCISGTGTDQVSWGYSRMNDDNVDTLVDAMLDNQPRLTGELYTQLSRHNLFLDYYFTYFLNEIFALSDKATKIACAIQHCDKSDAPTSPPWWPSQSNGIFNNIHCKVILTEEFEYGDELYQVSPSANYIPPTQDVICPFGTVTLEQREMVLEQINLARSKISQHTYELQNLELALPSSEPLLPLKWSCEDENAMQMEKMAIQCSAGNFFNPETEFQKIQPGTFNDLTETNFNNWWSQLGTQFFDHNPNLNFLSTSVTYPSPGYPEAFALSKDTESVACMRYICYNNPPTFHLICRVKPSLQGNPDLY